MIVGPKASAENNKKLGDMLWFFREERDISRRKAAETLGITPEYLRMIEKGKRTPAQGLMPHFAVLYGKTCTIRGDQVIFGTAIFEFTSRIKEVRESMPKLNSSIGRAERIGQIVQILDLVDDETLTKIYSLLQKKRLS